MKNAPARNGDVRRAYRAMRALVEWLEPNSDASNHFVKKRRGPGHARLTWVVDAIVAATPQSSERGVTRNAKPKRGPALGDFEREQLRVGVRAMYDENLDPELRLDANRGGHSVGRTPAIRNIAGTEAHAMYDALTYATESNAILGAGSIERAAWLAQGGVERKESETR